MKVLLLKLLIILIESKLNESNLNFFESFIIRLFSELENSSIAHHSNLYFH